MGRHDKEKDCRLTSRLRASKNSRGSTQNLHPPSSTAPQLISMYNIENGSHGKSNPPPSVPARTMPYSSLLPTRGPGDLHSSPSYAAQQALKRRRDGYEEKSVFNAGNESDLIAFFDNVNARGRVDIESGRHINSQKSIDGFRDGLNGLDAGNEGEAQGLALDLLIGIHEAAEVKGDGHVSGGDEDATGSMPSFSSESESDSESSSGSSSSSSSSEDGDEDEENNDVASESEPSAKVANGPESPLKRLKRKYPTIFGDDTSMSTSKSSVATRNPPPPELEGRFKYNNSVVGNNVYRYSKDVLDTLARLESLIPKSVFEFVTNNPSEHGRLHRRSSFMRKHVEGNEDTKRMLVVLEAATHLITHLGKVTVARSAAEELMKEELIRIARDRERDVEGLRGQIGWLTAEVGEMRDGKKRRRS